MPETKTRNVETPELPKGWGWQTGNRSDYYYTYNFGTNYSMGGPYASEYRGMGGMDGEVYWDEGGKHHVVIRPIKSIDGNGDPHYGYPIISKSYETEKEAVEAVPELIKKL